MNHPVPTDSQPDSQPESQHESQPVSDVLVVADDVADTERLEVRRNASVNAAVGVAASIVAIGYLGRATETGGVLDGVLCVVLAGLALLHLAGLLDSRAPLLVADGLGVRIRLGRTWQGLPWTEVDRVEVAARRGLVRDGALRVHPVAEQTVLAGLDAAGRRRATWSRRLRGASLAVPLSLSTRVVSGDGDVVAALRRLADEADATVEIIDLDLGRPGLDPSSGRHDAAPLPDPAPADMAWDISDDEDDATAVEPNLEPGLEPAPDADLPRRRLPDLRPGLARGIGALAARLPRRRLDVPVESVAADEMEPGDAAQHAAVEAVEPSAPGREPVAGSRSELLIAEPDDAADSVGGRELRRPGHVSLVEDTLVWGDRASRPDEGRLLIDDLAEHAAAEPAADPVIGPDLAAARGRLGLTVDQLAERTRIRPHVIESLEVDDFAPCGGDFYARGHLRTLARVLGLDAAPLLAAYDERYADAEISPRRVFEAELAAGPHGSIRGTRGGPNWSVLVAAVMALVLIWSVARLLTDGPVARDDAPALNGSPGLGLSGSGQQAADPIPVVLTAAGGGAHVVVRDGAGRVVFSGDVAFGDSRELQASPPVRVQSSDGSLEVSVAGADQGALGATGEPAQNTFLAP